MAVTRLSDVIVPDVFLPYMLKETQEKSAVFQSGILRDDPNLANFLRGGGQLINVPFWNDLGTPEPNTSSDDPNSSAVPQKITGDKDVAIRINRNQGWSDADLAAELAGDDPMKRIGERVSAYWSRAYQKHLIAMLKGVFADNVANNAGDMRIEIGTDVAGTPASSELVSAEAILDTKGNTTDDPMLLDWLADSNTEFIADPVTYPTTYSHINNRQRLNTIDRSEETAWNLANAGSSSQSGTSVDEYEVAWAAWVATAADPAGDASEAALRGGVGVYEGPTHDTYSESGREAMVRDWLTDVADGYIYSQAKADLIKYINQRAVANGVKFVADFGYMTTRDANKPWATKLHPGHVNPVDTAFKDQNGLGTTGGDKLPIDWMSAGRILILCKDKVTKWVGSVSE